MILNLLKMSAIGSVTICAVLLLRLCLRKAPKIFSYALWLVVLFRLLCPVSVALPISIYNLLQAEPARYEENKQYHQLPPRTNPGNPQAVLVEDTGQSTVQPAQKAEEQLVEQTAENTRVENQLDFIKRYWKEIVTILWLCGVCVMLAFTAADLRRLYQKLRYASLDQENIYLVDGIFSPFAAGILRPRIYLPYGLTDNERAYVLCHEQVHIRRGDPIFRVLSYLALILHWFNPFVWAAFFLSGKDMEMSCDEKVIQNLGTNIKCEYSQSLLLMAQNKKFTWKIPVAFGKGDTKERILNVLNYRKATVRVTLACILIVVLFAGALGADPIQHTDAVAQTKDMEQNGKTHTVTKRSTQDTSIINKDTEEDVTIKTNQTEANKTETSQTETDEIETDEIEVNYTEENEIEANISVRSISRSSRCIDSYVAPDSVWEETYGSTIAFSQDCRFYINECRDRLSAREVSFTKFAKEIEQGDISMNKSCIVEIAKQDHLIHKITLKSSFYRNGVTYIQKSESGDSIINSDFKQELKEYQSVRSENMDVAAVPGDETITVYQRSDSGCSYGLAVFEDKDGNLLHAFRTSTQGMCQSNLYIGNMDGAGDPFILEVHMENRDTYGEYSYYVYTLGKKRGEYIQTEGSRIEWAKDSSLIYDPGEMDIFLHMLGHYLTNSHLLVGMEMTDDGLKLRTDPDCDEERYTYAKCAPACFPDPYK